MSKSEFIIWSCETKEQIREQHPNWNDKQVRKYFSAVKAIFEREGLFDQSTRPINQITTPPDGSCWEKQRKIPKETEEGVEMENKKNRKGKYQEVTNMIEKLMTEQTKEEFVAMMIDFAAKKHLTIQNVVEATGEVVTYMTKNAVM